MGIIIVWLNKIELQKVSNVAKDTDTKELYIKS